MVGQRRSWVGLSVGDYVIKDLLGEGSYSWVFRAVHRDGQKVRAIKVAKPPEVVTEGGPTGCVPTAAFIERDESYSQVLPDTEQLLRLQAKKLACCDDPGLIPVEEVANRDGTGWYRMPVIHGQTLRNYMRSGPVPTDILLDVAITMDRLLADNNFEFHGDLKPENILITQAGVVLLDPGYFGKLSVQLNSVNLPPVECAVTSPQYYPRLKPDDVFAFGLIIWEIACRQQLLSVKVPLSEVAYEKIGDGLRQSILHEERRGNFRLSGLAGVMLPSKIRPGLPSTVESFLLQSIGIVATDEGRELDITDGFANFADMASALADLLNDNIRYL